MTQQLRALTVCQPYAWAIMSGKKPIENRSWRTSFRGIIAIHAGRSRTWLNTVDELDARQWGHIPPANELIYGAILGTAELAAIFDAEDGREIDPTACGPCCWYLHHVKPLPEPIGCSGNRGLWVVPEHVVAAMGEDFDLMAACTADAPQQLADDRRHIGI